jgi:beta-lactamase regulating signal transducer with metallopeptidase domain
MRNRQLTGGNSMTVQDRQLIVETLGEMRELKGEMKEFKQNVIERVQKLEKKDSERKKDRNSLFSVIIAFTALLVSIIVNFIKHGGNH